MCLGNQNGALWGELMGEDGEFDFLGHDDQIEEWIYIIMS